MKKNDPDIKVDFLSKSDIEKAVQNFCAEFRIDRTAVPVDVEKIVEFDLKLTLDPIKGVLAVSSADALLLSNREGIVVDFDRFMNPKYQNRLRFTIAHEIGHFVLHEKVYKDVTFDSVDEWIDFMNGIPDEKYRRLEWQCDEFAGRLLIEGTSLKQKFEEAKIKLKGTQFEKLDPLPQSVIEAMSGQIGTHFGVTHYPILIRLQSEGLWLPK